MSTSTPLSTWLNCREDVSVNQKDTTDMSHQPSKRLYEGKGSSSSSWQSSYTHTSSENESGVWHQVELRNSWCITPGSASPSCAAPRRSLLRKQMLRHPLPQPQGCVTGFVLPWFPPGEHPWLLLHYLASQIFFFPQLYNITRTAQLMCCAVGRYKYTLALTL